MKRLFFMAFVALAILACNKEKGVEAVDYDNGESVAVVSINIEGSAPGSRSVEDGHAGADLATVNPKVLSVTVIAYNEYGNEISQKDLDLDQIKKSAWGKGVDSDGNALSTTQPAGASVGLPSGTKKVDVIVNRPQGTNPNKYTNINYFNYRSDLADKGDNTDGSKDNFDRVYLTTEFYGTGKVLENEIIGADGTPQYKIDFTVSPSLARLEVFGAIEVAKAEDWVDAYNCKWKTMSVTDFEAKYNSYVASNQLKADPTTGVYTIEKTINGVLYSNVTFRNAVKGTADNGFDKDLVYFPQYYWYDLEHKSTDRNDAQLREEQDVDMDPNIGASWVQNMDFDGVGTMVQWYPNMFYAVDVESIFINNIKVRSGENDPYLHPWPESEASIGWPEWYKAYHIDGWHTAGASVGNTFLCMGNMWDRIATSDKSIQVDFPSVNNPGNKDQMSILTGKATTISGKSEYYNDNNARNLGVAKNKASAFQIYGQSLLSTNPTKEDVMASLPHVILKVKAYDSKADYLAGNYVKTKEFITIKAFKDASDKYVSKFSRAMIYRINLNDLLGAFTGKVPVPGGKAKVDPKDPIDPDPEMPGSQLSMTVKIMSWTIQNITPDI